MPQSSTNPVRLRDVVVADLEVFFEQQREPAANRMARFAARDRRAFMTHWRTKVLADDSVIKQTVLFGDEVAGNIVCFVQAGRRLVGYWVGQRYWGRGIATAALSEFVSRVRVRPLDARVAKNNPRSIRVLQKCGFTLSREAASPTSTPGEIVEEFVFTLE